MIDNNERINKRMPDNDGLKNTYCKPITIDISYEMQCYLVYMDNVETNT